MQRAILNSLTAGNPLVLHPSNERPVRRSKHFYVNGVQQAARLSILKLIRLLAAYSIDCGLSASEVNSILRVASVQNVARRQLEDNVRPNISGIAAMTGISRAEVSRILKSDGIAATSDSKRRQSPASRVLSAWHEDPNYSTAARRPKDLKIFGSGATFESLARVYGQGIPARAILDELTRIGAIEVRRVTQTVSPKITLATKPRINLQKIQEADVILADLFATTLENRRVDSKSIYGGKASGVPIASGRERKIRREPEPIAKPLLREHRNALTRAQKEQSGNGKRKTAQLKMTIHAEGTSKAVKPAPHSRRNFRRND